MTQAIYTDDFDHPNFFEFSIDVHSRFSRTGLTMAAAASAALITELEGPVDGRSQERWAEILRQMTGLFLAEAHRLNEVQMDLFDDVFLRLMKWADAQALALLSDNLSELSAAPRKTVLELASHGDISIAGAVLRKSSRLLDKDLLEIIGLRGEQHLLEISSRRTVIASLGDALAERGNAAVLSKLIQNLGARFSETGYAALVAKAKQNNGLAEKLVCRSDVPPALRRELSRKSGTLECALFWPRLPRCREKFKRRLPPRWNGSRFQRRSLWTIPPPWPRCSSSVERADLATVV
jgi:uncharacterized protein (DUF2336 family)